MRAVQPSHPKGEPDHPTCVPNRSRPGPHVHALGPGDLCPRGVRRAQRPRIERAVEIVRDRWGIAHIYAQSETPSLVRTRRRAGTSSSAPRTSPPSTAPAPRAPSRKGTCPPERPQRVTARTAALPTWSGISDFLPRAPRPGPVPASPQQSSTSQCVGCGTSSRDRSTPFAAASRWSRLAVFVPHQFTLGYAKGTCGTVFQAAGVALPQTVQQVAPLVVDEDGGAWRHASFVIS